MEREKVLSISDLANQLKSDFQHTFITTEYLFRTSKQHKHTVFRLNSQFGQKKRKAGEIHTKTSMQICIHEIIICDKRKTNQKKNSFNEKLQKSAPGVITLRFLSSVRPSCSVNSPALREFGKSCLLANTSNMASRSSSSDN